MLKLHINPIPGTLNNELFLVDSSKQVKCYLTFDKYGVAVANQFTPQYGEAWPVKPFMTLSEDLTRDVVQAFVELAQKRGIELESESKAKGKLEAMSAHLEDMRTLVFKKKS